MTTRKFALLGLVLGMGALAACDGKTDPPTVILPVDTPDVVVNLVPEELTLDRGQTGTLVAAVSGTANQAVTCTSSATNIATVTGGANGICTVTASTTNSGTAVVTAVSNADARARDASTVIVRPAVVVTPPGTPSVSIKSITQAGTFFPVNTQNITGQIDVTLNVEIPSGVTVTEVRTLVDNQVACRQTFGTTGSTGEIEVNAAAVEIVCSINTAAFNAATGAPTFPNGSRVISAEVVTSTGQTFRASNPTPVIFNNPSFITAALTFLAPGTTTTRGCVTAGSDPRSLGGPGSLWCGGDLVVNLVNVSFAPVSTDPLQDQRLGTATVTVRTSGNGVSGLSNCDSGAGANSGAVAPFDGGPAALENGAPRQANAITDPNGDGVLDFPGCGPVTVTRTVSFAQGSTNASVTFPSGTANAPDATTEANRGIFEIEDIISIEVTGVSRSGQAGPVCVNPDPSRNPLTDRESGAAVCGVGPSFAFPGATAPGVAFFPNPVRLDNMAPRVILFDIIPTSCANPDGCYLNAAFQFSTANTDFFRARDYGVDSQNANTTFQAGTSESTLANVTTGADLPETVTSQDLIIRARVRDALQNERLVFPDDSQNPTVVTTDDDDAQPFGIDKTPPELDTNLTVTPVNNGANDGTVFNFAFRDAGIGPSGFGPNPIFVRVERINTGGTTCRDPETGDELDPGNNGCSTGDHNRGGVIVPVTNGFVRADGSWNLGNTGTNAYYRVTFQLEDAAGNLTTQQVLTTLIDTTVPSSGAIVTPSVITGNASAAFSSSATDNLDLGDVLPAIQYGGLMTIEETRASVGTYNTPLTTSATASVTIANFIRSIENGLGGGITRASTANFLLRDVAGVVDNAACPALANAATQTASRSGTVAGTATTPWPVPTPAPSGNCFIRQDDISNAVAAGIPTSATSASRERSLSFTDITGFTLTSSVAGPICNSTGTGAGQPCPTNPSSTTLSASATGPSSTFGNPFQRVNFYYRDLTTGRSILIGSVTGPSVTDVGGVRTFVWQRVWNPAGLTAGDYTIDVLGVHSTGMALRDARTVQVRDD